MSYIGSPPKQSFTSGLLDRFTSTTGTTVTLTHDIASENDIVVFVNFVKQDSTTYSVGGTGNKTLTLGGTLVSSDIVEVHYLNIVGQTVAPSSGSVSSSQLTSGAVTGAKLNTDVISAQTELASGVASTDELLISDAGVLKRVDVSLVGGANTPSFMAVQTSATSLSAGAFTKVQFNSEIFDTDNTYDNSSNYRFTPATAGKYMIGASASCSSLDPDEFFKLSIYKNGSETITSNSINYKVTQQTRVANSLNPSLVVSFVDLADDDDYYEVFAYNGDGGANNTDLNLGNFFYGYKIIT